MAEIEREVRRVQVRSLAGESTTISISQISTIEELKLKLKESFLPAKDSPNFHLFFKGTKLILGRQIGSLSFGHDDFLVLVPFTKKARPQMHHQFSSQPTASSQDPNQNTASSFADLAWSDMMSDLSFLSGTSRNGVQPDLNAQGKDKVMKERFFNHSSSTQRRKRSNYDVQERPLDDLVHSIQGTASGKVFDEQNSEKFLQFLESIDCLSDPKSRNCSLKVSLAYNDTIPCNEKKKSCLCPSWLKRTLKGFAFINTFYMVLQMRSERFTSDQLDGALKQLGKFGFDFDIADLKHISVLCPEVVKFGDQETAAANVGDSIVIFNSLIELGVEADNHRTARKKVRDSTVIDKMKIRDTAFRKRLLEAVTSFTGKTMFARRVTTLLSLEDLLKSMEESGDAAKCSEAKCTRSRSATSSSHSLQELCQDTNELSPGEMVEHLRKGLGSQGQIVHIEEIGVRKAMHVEILNELSETTRSALQRIGVTRLYSHQAEAIQASLSGKDVVVATMTSSGKSLCYNVPVLEALTQNLLSCALYLFPTKALAQDQLRALLVMTEGLLDISKNIGVYDGDTSQHDRKWIRSSARLLISNPDMLHMSILPYHGQFQRILSNLRFVIIDEAHVYKGAFGCHTALILRRLRRLCCHVYGSNPSFVFSTATSANPREHAMELANLSILELIQKDGSPCGPKNFIMWNPSLCPTTVSKTLSSSDTSKYADREVSTRHSSPVLVVSCLFAEMVQHGLRCIAFCKTRKLTELVLFHTREMLQVTAPDLVGSICAYRGGYIAEERRRIENEFFNGKLRGVAATNALELGIDVGHIDATLHLGFPGTVASLWQQAGRSGRRERPALAVYVAFESPLDQYFMKFPQKLFRRPIESCHVYAHNQQVLEQHLVCAALEHPLSLVYDEKYFGSCLNNSIMSLTNKGYLSSDPSRDLPSQIWSYIGHEKKPSHAISIRAIETERYKVITNKSNEVLEEIEESKAFFQVYEGAVYMHQGKTYLVKALDLSTKVALCQEANLKYYTKTRDYTDINVIGGAIAYPARISDVQQRKTSAQTNNCKVTTTWFGFYRIWRGSNKIFEEVELSLPRYSYESQAVWIQVPQSIKSKVEIQHFSFRAGLHAACHALLNTVPLYIMCNSSDLASECANPHETRDFPERILLYDQHPGGIGLSAQVQPLFAELLASALELVTTCPCLGASGCPNCVQNLLCHEYNEVLDKNAALIILQGIIEAEDSFQKWPDSSKTSNTEDHQQTL